MRRFVKHHLGHAENGEMALGRIPFGEQAARAPSSTALKRCTEKRSRRV